ncbi:hypothetical protein A2U01_0002456 [Trifolium medium]|uniref:Uncharacterized protein n=1 Tax=Trifolium medium TaxID=97028 RepID=A0A392M336_9FABA|nr:hypothetical protein [Trifolium medium]
MLPEVERDGDAEKVDEEDEFDVMIDDRTVAVSPAVIVC